MITSSKQYVLAMLTFVYTLSYVDQNLVSLLLQPIKVELQLSDTQLGLLTGIAFALFYALLGVPIARWADRGDRVLITSFAMGLWGLTVMACMLVTNFVQLVIARVAAGVGEAGCMPPTYSLIGDYFPGAAERTRAMTIYMLGNPLSTLISFVMGGWLNDLYGWRVTFLLMGIPGLLIAVLVRVTIVDPRSRLSGSSEGKHTSIVQEEQPRFLDVLGRLWRQRSSRHLCLGLILLYTLGTGLSPWYAAFMMRNHGMGTAETGTWLGLIFGIVGVGGVLLGGYVADRWFSENERGQMRTSAVAIVSLVPFFALYLLAPSKVLSLSAMIPLVVVFTFFLGPTFALLQRLVADDARASTLAVVMLLVNLIGMGIGPQVVGLMSDLLQPAVGVESLRYSMLAMSSVAMWAGWHFWQVGAGIREDLAAVADLTARSDRVAQAAGESSLV